MTAKRTVLHDDPFEEWARVELYRWQYGQLDDTSKRLDVSAGLSRMADAIELACKDHGRGHPMPTPFNVCAVLRFCAGQLKKQDAKETPNA